MPRHASQPVVVMNQLLLDLEPLPCPDPRQLHGRSQRRSARRAAPPRRGRAGASVGALPVPVGTDRQRAQPSLARRPARCSTGRSWTAARRAPTTSATRSPATRRSPTRRAACSRSTASSSFRTTRRKRCSMRSTALRDDPRGALVVTGNAPPRDLVAQSAARRPPLASRVGPGLPAASARRRREGRGARRPCRSAGLSARPRSASLSAHPLLARPRLADAHGRRARPPRPRAPARRHRAADPRVPATPHRLRHRRSRGLTRPARLHARSASFPRRATLRCRSSPSSISTTRCCRSTATSSGAASWPARAPSTRPGSRDATRSSTRSTRRARSTWSRSSSSRSSRSPRNDRATLDALARGVHARRRSSRRSDRRPSRSSSRASRAGDLCAIVTATNAFVTAPIARRFGIEHLIGDRPGAGQDGRFTGGVRGEPCFREGKVNARDRMAREPRRVVAELRVVDLLQRLAQRHRAARTRDHPGRDQPRRHAARACDRARLASSDALR